MSKLSRYLLLIFSVILFLFATPLIILYAQGLRLTASGGLTAFQQTGGIIIKSQPRAFLEISQQGSKTIISKSDRLISGLSPGTYQVSLKKAGFRPWVKNILVLPEIVSIHPEVHLILEKLPLIPVTTTLRLQNFKLLDSGKILLFTKNETSYLLDPVSGTLEPVPNQKLKKIQTPRFIFEKETLTLAKLGPDNNIEQTILLSSIFSAKPNKVIIKSSQDSIYLLADSTLIRLSSLGLAGPLKARFIASNVSNFDIKKERLLFWRSHELWSMNLQISPIKASLTLIAQSSRPFKKAQWISFSASGPPSHLIYQTGNNLIFSENLAQDFAYQTPLVSIDPDSSFELDSSTNILYFLKDSKLYKLEFGS
jgi:hypothetical protein